MKKIIILSCIAVLSLGKIFAQDHSATDKQDLQDEQKIANQTPARQASIRAERIAEKLHLNPEQTKKLIDAVVRYYEVSNELSNARIAPEEKAKNLKGVEDKLDKDVNLLLTPDQFKVFKKLIVPVKTK